jgi:hypothetical protein
MMTDCCYLFGSLTGSLRGVRITADQERIEQEA